MPTKLITKYSTVAGVVPSSGDLEVAELAVNVTDERLFTKNSANQVVALTFGSKSFYDFGAVGNGVTDDTQALQDAFDYATANRAVLAPTRGVFLVNAPIIVGDFSGINGYTSSNKDASCVIKAGSSFTSSYTMTYYGTDTGSTPQTYNIAAILISKAWVDGAQIGNPIHIGKILLDADSRTDNRGAPIHGIMFQAWASSD